MSDGIGITYWLPDRKDFELDYVELLPPIGGGVFHDGVSYRVRDVWLIDDDNGALPMGFNVFLGLPPKDDEFLEDFELDYFGR